jgi:hypothetical protein
LYFSPNIIRVIKLRRMPWAWHAALQGRGKVHRGFCGETWGKETTWKIQAWTGG